MNNETNISLSHKELTTVLASLRFFQEQQVIPGHLKDHFYENEPLTDPEIDLLCDRLNYSDSYADTTHGERLSSLAEIETLLGECYKERALTRIWHEFPEIKYVTFAELPESSEVSPGTVALTDIKFNEGQEEILICRLSLELVAAQYAEKGDFNKFWECVLCSIPPRKELIGKHQRPDTLEESTTLVDVIEQIGELGKALAYYS